MAEFDDWTEISTLGDLLIRAAHLEGGCDAVVFPDRRIRYDALLEGAGQCEQKLRAPGADETREAQDLAAPQGQRDVREPPAAGTVRVRDAQSLDAQDLGRAFGNRRRYGLHALLIPQQRSGG